MSKKRSSAHSSSQRILPQEAARSAAEYLKAFVPDAAAITVEEVESGPEDTEWRITLSYQSGGLPFMAKKYKLFVVNAQTGDVLSMRIRKE
ncbi:MAG: hypothetical protein ABII12_03505 [Planctomycetota bacterium]